MSDKRHLPAAKRMTLSQSGAIRALGRSLADLTTGPERDVYRAFARFPDPERKGDMEANLEEQVYNATIVIHGTPEAVINLDLETSFAVLENAWRVAERALIEANAAYNETDAERHDRAKRLLWAADDLRQAANVVYALTPMPEDPQDEGEGEAEES